MFSSKFCGSSFVILLTIYCVVFGNETFMGSFQTNIKSNSLATTNVWLEFTAQILQAKEVTICHWMKINLHNTDFAGSLWSYCTVKNPGQDMECLQAFLRPTDDKLGRTLIYELHINLFNYDESIHKRKEIVKYRHRTWVHLCWSFSARTGESK